MVFYHFKNIIDEPKKEMMRMIMRKEKYTSILDRFQRDETFHENQKAHGWTGAWCKHLDYVVNIDISHNGSPEQRARCTGLYHFRYASDNLGPTKARPDYHIATRAIISMNKEAGQKPQTTSKSGKARNDLDPQKNVNGSSGCHKTGKFMSQMIDTQQVRVPLNVTIDRQTTSQHSGNRCRQVPLKIGGRILGGSTQHGMC